MLLAAGLVALAVLNFIPIVGWLINLVVMLLGLGSITLLILERLLIRSENTTSPEAEPIE